MVQVEAPTPQEDDVGICVQVSVEISSNISPVVPLIEFAPEEERIFPVEKSMSPV